MSDEETQRRSPVRLFVPLTLVVAVIALGVSAFVLSRRAEPEVDEGAVTVARQAARNFFSLDYREAAADTKRVLALATGSFAKQYSAKLTQIANGLVAKKAVLAATVADNAAAVEYQHGDSARILVAVDATTSVAGKAGAANRYRVRVQLVRQQDAWRVSAFDQVG